MGKLSWWAILLLVVAVVGSACGTSPEPNPSPGEVNVPELPSLEGHLFVLFICVEGHNQRELDQTYNAIIELTDANVVIATLLGGPTEALVNTDQEEYLPVVKLGTIDPATVDGFAVIGGDVTMHWDDPDLLDFMQELDSQGGVFAGVCGGAAMLANAGFLDGRGATAEAKYRSRMEEYGVIWIHGSVHVDGRYVTARYGSEGRMVQEMIKLIADTP